MINGYDRMLQEILVEQDRSGWRMLVGCILLNQTSRLQVDGVRDDLFRVYPNAQRMSHAHSNSLSKELQPLGLHNRRAATLIKFSKWWLHARGDVEEILGQQMHGDLGERIRAMEPPGVGEYARDSWIIFMEGVVPDWPPADHVLKEYLHQRAGASGVIW